MSGPAPKAKLKLTNYYNPYGYQVFNTFNRTTQERLTVKMMPLSVVLKPVPGYEALTLKENTEHEPARSGLRIRKKIVSPSTKLSETVNLKPMRKRVKSKVVKVKTEKKEKGKPNRVVPPIKIKIKPAVKRPAKMAVTAGPNTGNFIGGNTTKPKAVEIMVTVDPQDFEFDSNAYDSTNGFPESHIQFNDLTNRRPPPDGYECSVCFETFMLQEDLHIHRRSHRFSYGCTECTNMFDSAAELNSHAKCHAVLNKKANLENRRAAEALNYRHYSPSSPLTFTELSDAYIACDDCGETFMDNQSLKVHYLGHFGLVESSKAVRMETPIRASQSHGSSGYSGMVRDRELVPFGMSSFQYPSSPSTVSSHGHGQMELAQYTEFLVMSENMKRVAFALNDSTLMDKMLDVESHVARKIMTFRASSLSPTSPFAQSGIFPSS